MFFGSEFSALHLPIVALGQMQLLWFWFDGSSASRVITKACSAKFVFINLH